MYNDILHYVAITQLTPIEREGIQWGMRDDRVTQASVTRASEGVMQGHLDISISGLILGLHRANERRRYFVMTSLIGWAQA